MANAQALLQLVSTQQFHVIQDYDLAELALRGTSEYERMDEVDKYRIRLYVAARLNCWGNIFYQHKNGLIDEAVYSAWRRSYEDWAERRLGTWWAELKDVYDPEFQLYVEGVINRAREKAEKTHSTARPAARPV